MTAFPPIEVIRDRFPTHRSNRSSSVSKELKGFLSPSRGSAIRARRSEAAHIERSVPVLIGRR
jgi:hypothetical protein